MFLKTLSMTFAAITLAMATSISNAAIIKGKVYLKIEGDKDFLEKPFVYKGKGIYTTKVKLEKGNVALQIGDEANTCGKNFGPLEDEMKLKFNTPFDMNNCAKSNNFTMRVFMATNYLFTIDNSDGDNPKLTVSIAKDETPRKRMPPPIACHKWDGNPVTVDVSSMFKDGELLKDAYSGQTAKVENGKVTMQPAKESGGILLLEQAKHQATPFDWDNAQVYFIMTDRFNNGRTDNDHSYGRKKDGEKEIGTFHGGDFKGITEKLDYIKALGMDAIWITPIIENIHGFIAGDEGAFPFYGYHGYWAKDFTKIDANWGTEEEFRTLVDEAHKRGIRVLIDVVMNHVGYDNLADMQAAGMNVVDTSGVPEVWTDWVPDEAEDDTWDSYFVWVDYESKEWAEKWWGPEWVRAGLPGYPAPGGDDLTMNLAGLPDFLTENKKPVGLPPILKNKKDTRAKELPNATIVDYLIDWHTYWVREFGVDGFRSDTVKHIEYEPWLKLKKEASKAYEDWKKANPDKKIADDRPFWMVGEVWDWPVFKGEYYDYGFDALVNFDFQKKNARMAAQCMTTVDKTYEAYAGEISKDPTFNAMSYISSHDTKLFFGDFESIELQRNVAAPFLLLPGAVQIYYGDESGRANGPINSDAHQATRSDMNWSEHKGEKAELIEHWKKFTHFRQRHAAVGGGKHTKISEAPYVFSRQKGDDKVIVVFAGRQKEI